MAKPIFKPHGSHQLEVQGRILQVHTRGPWNAEEVQRYVQSFSSCVDQLTGKPWGVLAFVYGEAIHTPESQQRMVDAIVLHRRTGRCATAVLLRVDIPPDFVRAIFTRMYAQAQEPSAFFDDEAVARAWLITQIANANAATGS
jgi:hypothetical protein